MRKLLILAGILCALIGVPLTTTELASTYPEFLEPGTSYWQYKLPTLIPGLLVILGSLVAFIIAIFAEAESMFWKIVLVLGILGILLGIAVTGISVALPIVNGPHTSWEEAMYGIIPGVFVLIVSFFIFLIGLIFVIKNRKKNKLAGQPGNIQQFG